MLPLAGVRGLSMFIGLPIAFAQKEDLVTLGRRLIAYAFKKLPAKAVRCRACNLLSCRQAHFANVHFAEQFMQVGAALANLVRMARMLGFWREPRLMERARPLVAELDELMGHYTSLWMSPAHPKSLPW